jgi:FkbM family methyltransferase
MNALRRISEVVGVDDHLDRLLFAHRVSPTGRCRRPRLAGVEATFVTTTWPEYRRATTYFGEKWVLTSLLTHIGGDDVVWDIGAGVGTYACFVANAVESGTVVAFEPHPANARALETNLRASAAEDRWTTEHVALAATDGTVGLASEDGHEKPGTGHHYIAETSDRTVPCSRGETLVADGVPTPTVLKIDVQGAELAVLRGMGAVLDDVETIYLEVHPRRCRRYDTSPDRIEAFLTAHGFRLRRLGDAAMDKKRVYYLRATR